MCHLQKKPIIKTKFDPTNPHDVEKARRSIDKVPPIREIGTVGNITAGAALGNSEIDDLYYNGNSVESYDVEGSELSLGYTPDPNIKLKKIYDPIIHRKA